MSKATHTAPTRITNARPKSEISRIADEIARLQQLARDIDCKGATDACDADTLPADMPRLPDGRDRRTFFEMIDEEANDRIDALEHAVSVLEPETLDDVLTLAVLWKSEIDRFHEKYLEKPADERDYQFAKAERRVERMGHAVIRGFMKFASSPIVSAGYVREAWDTMPWSEELATADAELAKLPNQCEADTDPTNSATQH